MASPVPKLFQPIRVGTANLQHRVVFEPGTLAITEGTIIALHAGAHSNVPGIWNDEEIAGWKPYTRMDPFIFLQLWVPGRAAIGDFLRKAGNYSVVGPSAIPMEGYETPRELTIEEIKEYVKLHATAVENAVLKAGFDGVEIHSAIGYLPDQFIQAVSNTRTDEYGGSVENRLRDGNADPIPTFAGLVTRIRDSYPDFAYIRVVEGAEVIRTGPEESARKPSTKFLREIWGNRPYITNANYERDTALEVVEKKAASSHLDGTSYRTWPQKLFRPIRVGNADLQHRVVLAPMKRARADEQHVHGTLALEYYKQRTSVPGTLAITEGTFIAPKAGGQTNIPGIWDDKQIAGWKPITDAVHANGSSIFLQLWALGRVAEGDALRKAGNYSVAGPSDIAMEGYETPRALTVEEIKEYAELYAAAAENAVLKAGFDGVEIHSASGYLRDQFLQTASNHRTDEYGGSVENRLRFVSEVTDAVVQAVGANRVGIRLSPYLTMNGMGMPDPVPTFAGLVTRIRDSYPDFAYLHVLEATDLILTGPKVPVSRPSVKFLRDIWGDRPYIANANYERDTAIEVVEREGGLVSFARHFSSNPDLPRRLKENIELTPCDPGTWWTQGAEGYIDYPFAEEAKTVKVAAGG
ncbi:hypothetical protein EI94DRAFT_1828846 [Lactarius quietus]|nr:hypothetical protein EI94DRAFT_1828846 [Lactarius quietus]